MMTQGCIKWTLSVLLTLLNVVVPLQQSWILMCGRLLGRQNCLAVLYVMEYFRTGSCSSWVLETRSIRRLKGMVRRGRYTSPLMYHIWWRQHVTSGRRVVHAKPITLDYSLTFTTVLTNSTGGCVKLNLHMTTSAWPATPSWELANRM